MISLFENGINGILADEMVNNNNNNNKTIITIIKQFFLMHLHCYNYNRVLGKPYKQSLSWVI